MKDKNNIINTNLNYKGYDFNIIIIYKNNKNMYCRFNNNTIKITAPFNTSQEYIIKWIIDAKLLDKVIKKSEKINKLEIKNNCFVKLFGYDYLIKIDNFNKIDYQNNIIYLIDETIENYIKLLNNELKNYCDKQTLFYFNLMYNNTNFKLPKIKYKIIKTYHGQYNKKNNIITYNILLGLIDYKCIDYVIIHELCHIKYLNHQLGFHKLLDKYCPNNIYLRKKLNKEWISL